MLLQLHLDIFEHFSSFLTMQIISWLKYTTSKIAAYNALHQNALFSNSDKKEYGMFIYLDLNYLTCQPQV